MKSLEIVIIFKTLMNCLVIAVNSVMHKYFNYVILYQSQVTKYTLIEHTNMNTLGNQYWL